MNKLKRFISALMLIPAALSAATISGTVTTGATGGAAGTPVASAKVVLIGIGGGGGGGGLGARLDSTTTAADGKYSFTMDTTGFRQIQATATGYSTGTAFVNVARDSAYTANVNLVSNAPGSITGKVVKASDSSALAGARVILSRQGGGGGGGGFTPDTVLTGSNGTYTFAGVPGNAGYSLNVSLAGYTTVNRNNITVAGGQAATQNFALAAPIGPGSIAGKVANAAGGSAIAGARVILSRTGGGGGGGGFASDTVLTDAQGMFAYDTVPNQTNYVLTVSATGFGTAVNNNVDVSGGLKTTVNFALSEAVAGDTTGTIQGVVTNASAAPVANARVILTRINGQGGGGNGTPVDTVVTDATGKFSFAKLAAPGNYRLNVSGTGYQNAQSNTMNLARGVTFIANVELAAPSAIRSAGAGFRQAGSHWLDGRLVVDLDASKRARAAEVYGSDGKLKFRMALEPGAARVILPAHVKPGMGILRIRY